MLVWCSVLFNAHRAHNTTQQDCNVGHTIITTKLAEEHEVNMYSVQVLIMNKNIRNTHTCYNVLYNIHVMVQKKKML